MTDLASASANQDFFDIFNAFATDPELELKGKWFTVGPKARMKIARTGNDNYNAEFKRLVEKHSLDLQDGGPGAEKIAAEIMTEVQAKTILVDWDGIGFQGKLVEYSPEMAKTMLAVKDFKKLVLAKADSFEEFRVKAEAALGNA